MLDFQQIETPDLNLYAFLQNVSMFSSIYDHISMFHA